MSEPCGLLLARCNNNNNQQCVCVPMYTIHIYDHNGPVTRGIMLACIHTQVSWCVCVCVYTDELLLNST